MAVDTAQYVGALNTALPDDSDDIAEGDDQIRAFKTAVAQSFPSVTGAVTATHIELNHVDGVTAPIQPQLDAKGAHVGQVWTGTHDFTGAAVTVVAPASGSNPVTKTYADALAFASALPGISSATAGMSVVNNGSVASWGHPALSAKSFYFATM